MTCSEHQTRQDLVESLFNTREESENSIDRLNTPSGHLKNKTHDTAIQSHKASRSIQTLDSRASDKSQTSNTGSRKVTYKFIRKYKALKLIFILKFPLLADEDHSTPISPVDFNLRKRDRPPFIISRTNGATPVYTSSILQKEFIHHKKDRSRWSDHEDLKRTYTSSKLAQTIIMQNLDSANESIQALLLELIVTKELKMSNVRYNVPKPFLVIAVLPQGYNRLSISSQLVKKKD